MKRLALALSAALLSACNQNLITPTTNGTQPAAGVTRISGIVAPTVTELTLTLPGVTTAPATMTPPAAGNTQQQFASFVLPLPSSLPDANLARFMYVFAPGTCKASLTGNTLARVAVADTLTSGAQALISQTNAVVSGVLQQTRRVLYLYSDRATYLRGTVTCQASSGGATSARVTGFELNLLRGWNRVLLTESYADDSKGSLYATTPRTTGNTSATELWQAEPLTSPR